MARYRTAGPANRAPERIQRIERVLYVKALRLANDEPTEVAEITHLHNQLVRWMTNTENRLPAPQAALLPGEKS